MFVEQLNISYISNVKRNSFVMGKGNNTLIGELLFTLKCYVFDVKLRSSFTYDGMAVVRIGLAISD